jgi:hypothetical protein
MLNAERPQRCLIGLIQIWHCKDIPYLRCQGYVFGVGGFWVPKETGSVITLTGSIFLLLKP